MKHWCFVFPPQLVSWTEMKRIYYTTVYFQFHFISIARPHELQLSQWAFQAWQRDTPCSYHALPRHSFYSVWFPSGAFPSQFQIPLRCGCWRHNAGWSRMTQADWDRQIERKEAEQDAIANTNSSDQQTFWPAKNHKKRLCFSDVPVCVFCTSETFADTVTTDVCRDQSVHLEVVVWSTRFDHQWEHKTAWVRRAESSHAETVWWNSPQRPSEFKKMPEKPFEQRKR